MDDDGSSKDNGVRPAEELNPAAEPFINGMGQLFERYGIPAIGGRLLGLLVVTSQPLSAEQIASILQVSRGSVSTNIRLLLLNGIAEKVVVTGDRRDYYQMPVGGLDPLVQVSVRQVQEFEALAEQGLAAVPPTSPARANVEEFADYARFTYMYLANMVADWRKYKAQKNN